MHQLELLLKCLMLWFGDLLRTDTCEGLEQTAGGFWGRVMFASLLQNPADI